MKEGYSSKDKSWRWGLQQDPRVEAGIHCLVGSLLAWGLSYAK